MMCFDHVHSLSPSPRSCHSPLSSLYLAISYAQLCQSLYGLSTGASSLEKNYFPLSQKPSVDNISSGVGLCDPLLSPCWGLSGLCMLSQLLLVHVAEFCHARKTWFCCNSSLLSLINPFPSSNISKSWDIGV